VGGPHGPGRIVVLELVVPVEPDAEHIYSKNSVLKLEQVVWPVL
jgi:hypothetical protein